MERDKKYKITKGAGLVTLTILGFTTMIGTPLIPQPKTSASYREYISEQNKVSYLTNLRKELDKKFDNSEMGKKDCFY